MNEGEKCVQFHFMASEAEAEAIAGRMAAAGVRNLSAYLRKMAIDGYIIRMDMKDVRELSGLLRRCSNNLNQYAKKANETGNVHARDVKDLRARLDGIWDLASSILSGFAKIP